MVSRLGIDETICKFGGSFANQRFNQLLFLLLKAEYYIHKILTPKYWHDILKLAIFNGPKPYSTTVKTDWLLVSIKSLINWNWDNYCSGDFNSYLPALGIHLGLVNSDFTKKSRSQAQLYLNSPTRVIKDNYTCVYGVTAPKNAVNSFKKRFTRAQEQIFVTPHSSWPVTGNQG